MIRSMTGFGRAETTGAAFTMTVEIRSVNHRHLDVALRVPRALASFETEARKLVASRVDRGRVDVAVQLTPAAGRATQQIVSDAPLAAEYMAQARAIARDIGVAGDVTLEWVLERPGVMRLQDVDPPDPASLWPALADALARALDALVLHRSTEGAALADGIAALADDLAREVDQITARAPAAALRREGRLRDRLKALVGDVTRDESRILIEAATWAEKTDVAEELARLRAHLAQCRAMLDKGGPLGRSLDFLIQELHREVNTIGSKADDLEVSQAVLTAKGIIEKMREQTQNLE